MNFLHWAINRRLRPSEVDRAAVIKREVAKQMPAWNPPAECADVAEETLERYRRFIRNQRLPQTETEIEWIARELAMANLEERASFRREIAEYTA